jgi:hypothetical protein
MEIQLIHAKRMFLLLGIVLIGIQFIPTAITPSPVASVRGQSLHGSSCQWARFWIALPGLPFREHAMAVV